MIISSASDYRAAAKRKLPRFLFDYIDGGAYAEHTMRANSSDLAEISLRQRILRNVDSLSLKTTLFGQEHAMPIILSPVGLTGYVRTARRGAGGQGGGQQGDSLLSVDGVGVFDRGSGVAKRAVDLVPALCAQGPRLYA